MACNFNLNIHSTAAELVQNMQSKIAGQGGTFTGDENSGTFSVSLMGSTISGSYSINGQQMAVNIDHKPFFLGCGQIQSYLEGNL